MITSTELDINMDGIEYEKRLVLFLDILGFSNLVGKSSSDQQILLEIIKCLKVIERELQKEKEFQENHEYIQQLVRNKPYINPGKIDYTQFSDSIIISTPYISPHSLHNLITSVSLLQARFLQEGILFRGGIAYGDMYHKENLCFGPAFIKAYTLESKIAIYPRVIIDNDIITGNIIPDNWTNEDKLIFDGLKHSLGLGFNPVVLMDKTTEGKDLYYVNFMLLETFRKSSKKIVSIFEEQKSHLNIKDDKQEKVYLKLDWLTSTINEFMKNFKKIDDENKEFFKGLYL